MASSKRSPAVLVTDARERPPHRGPGLQRSAIAGPSARPNPRRVSVDNVLQYASDIPSGQPRGNPALLRSMRSVATAAAAAGMRRAALQGGVGLPTLASARTGHQNVPSRTTKVSEKLVLIPEAPDEGDEEGLESDEELARRASLLRRADDEERPLRDEELDVLKKRGGIRGKSYAERLPKVQRGEKVARLTAYCTAQSYKLKATAEFLKKTHEAKTKLYDDCLYVVYHLPLLPGHDGYRLRSRPVLKTPGTGKTVLDLEIERNERRDEHEGFWEEYSYPPRFGNSHDGAATLLQPAEAGAPGPLGVVHASGSGGGGGGGADGDGDAGRNAMTVMPINRLVPDAKNFGEVFVFSYGVVVFWNFTEYQEKDILADLTFSENETGIPLVFRPLNEDEFETEEFHFEYSADAKRPRIFNDMITLLPRSDHMVKLTISHAIAQSTKLCFFEERMSQTMLEAQHIPKRLALTGELNMTRTEIVKMLGRLFKSRVDINLSSNILDVPNFFWDSEPTLHPLYEASREYLEIDPRIKVLNERCRVFLDLADILADSDADAKMSSITWIIIILIVISIVVTVSEVGLRFAMLSRDKDRLEGRPSDPRPSDLRLILRERNVTLEELRLWSRALSESERAAVCGGEVVGETFAGV
ncbi:hypothetical protein VTJ83DRAFT_371 [Remersonia thermophila]|uniref:DUF155 domain-containing protein n=1 Tax=Remersonia thermophila TaxID=72144 RepID=A0ABR4DKW0_9PEZI